MSDYGICDFCEGCIDNCPHCRGKGGIVTDDSGAECPWRPPKDGD